MTQRDDGGPAFPVSSEALRMMASQAKGLTGGALDEVAQKIGDVVRGMTLRDYFAAKAPDRALDVSDWSTATCEEALGLENGGYRWREHYPRLLAKLAYEYADAMLKARGA